MSYNDKDLPRTKVAMRGKMLVAWLAEANPPVLLRILAANTSGGFSLKHGDGKVDLVQHDGSPNPQTIASFSSDASAERALSRFSRTLLSYKAPWKRALKVFGLILAVLAIFILLRLAEVQQQRAAQSALAQLKTLAAQRPPTNTAAATSGSATPLLLPGMAPPGSAPAPAKTEMPMGSPIDVDKAYH